MSKFPVGFLSYARADDEHDNGYLTKFRKRLSGEVSAHTGEIFDIFQDRDDIGWGQNWRRRIEDSIDAGIFLVCIITPRFFKSDACRSELERFLARERELGRNDLILPVYYITCPSLEDPAKSDSLMKQIRARHWADWRELRHEPLDAPEAKKMLSRLADDIQQALDTRLPEGLVNSAGLRLPSMPA